MTLQEARILLSEDYQKITQPIIKWELFFQWLRNLFLIDDALTNHWDPVYQRQYVVNLYDLLISGIPFLNKCILVKYNQPYIKEWLSIAIHGIEKIQDEISDDEFYFLKYHRDSYCHIHQNAYELFKDDGTIKGEVKCYDKRGIKIRKKAIEIKRAHYRILDQYNDDEFNMMIQKRLHPILDDLRKNLQNVLLNRNE